MGVFWGVLCSLEIGGLEVRLGACLAILEAKVSG